MCDHHHHCPANPCGCCHHHQSENRHMLYRIAVAVILSAAAFSGLFTPSWQIGLFIAAYFAAGYDIIWLALKNLLHGAWLDENALMTIATAGALAIGEYPEAVLVMILYQSGEYLQHKAVEKSKRSIAALMDIRPDFATVEENGNLVRKAPAEVTVGTVIVVKSGEKIPLDGIVISGEAAVDTSALTGESLPRVLHPGDPALSGCINTNGILRIEVNKSFGESTAAKILELVEHADARKARTEKFITRFARYYTPAVVGAAVLLAILPPLIMPEASFSQWLQRALTFLVISCPCALVISVPLTFFAGIGGASRNGILIKGSNYLETLSRTGTVVFDKTGTLTRGVFEVSRIIPQHGVNKRELLEAAVAAENISNHPIALSIRRTMSSTNPAAVEGKAEELAGMGVRLTYGNNEILAGNLKMMQKFKIAAAPQAVSGTVVYVAKNQRYLGTLVISDQIKDTAENAVRHLHRMGIDTVMLSGDTSQAAENVTHQLGIDTFRAGLLPEQKVAELEKQIDKSGFKSVIFVGDGINDAPVLTRADVGIAMGALGSDAAVEAADAVIMDDNPERIAEAIKASRKTMSIVRQNIVLALAVKGAFLLLGAAGLMTMWGAVFADVGVTMLAVLNALRALKA